MVGNKARRSFCCNQTSFIFLFCHFAIRILVSSPCSNKVVAAFPDIQKRNALWCSGEHSKKGKILGSGVGSHISVCVCVYVYTYRYTLLGILESLWKRDTRIREGNRWVVDFPLTAGQEMERLRNRVLGSSLEMTLQKKDFENILPGDSDLEVY